MGEILETPTRGVMVRTFLLTDFSIQTSIESLVTGEEVNVLHWTNADARQAYEEEADEDSILLGDNEIQAYIHRSVWRAYNHLEKSRWAKTAS